VVWNLKEECISQHGCFHQEARNIIGCVCVCVCVRECVDSRQKNACLQMKCCQVLLTFLLWTVLWLLKLSFGKMTCCFIIRVSSFASAVEPDYCCWKKDFQTFEFYLFSCEKLQTLKEIYFGVVECCQQNCTLVSARDCEVAKAFTSQNMSCSNLTFPWNFILSSCI